MARKLEHTFCIAPMMECTDRHFRHFLRLISRRSLLYTEMITTEAMLYGDLERLAAFDPIEHPLALQLGGSDPDQLARCAGIAQEMGYDEVNLNVGCPSPRVQRGRFGASLMIFPELVADCVASMQTSTDLPVTVKTRIGVDDQDSYDVLARFVNQVARAGCRTFIVHARKAWLQGLSPKQNREIPPLQYDRVYRLKRDFIQLEIILNGGIKDLDVAKSQLQHVDGVMLGREIYKNPYLLADVDQMFYSENERPRSRDQVLEAYLPYIEQQLKSGISLHSITRHLMGLFQGLPGARSWRRQLGELGARPGADVEGVRNAAGCVEVR